MDIRARDLLGKIRKIKGAENAVIAGGAVRDVILGYEPKDYDIFIPAEGFKGVVETLGIDTKSHPESKEYQQSIASLKAVRQGEYEGIKFELMKNQLANDDNFGKNVISTFDFGICMAYYEGANLLREADEFISDRDNHRMSLLKLRNIQELPKAVSRFNRLNEKLGNKFYFHCPLLKIEQIKKEEDSGVFDSYVNDFRDPNRDRFDNLLQIARENLRLNPAAEIPVAPVEARPDQIFIRRPEGAINRAVNFVDNQRAVPPENWGVVPLDDF